MNTHLDQVIEAIGQTHRDEIDHQGRHYTEVSIGAEAEKLGFADVAEKYRNAWALVPLKGPVSGMKVRIDGRTFVKYVQFDSGVAVPGYVAAEAGLASHEYTAQDSMVLNFT